MPISSLPDSTLRAITSTLVLNDAISVVKELVDNALDAKATTIAVEISANTLDVIQVKDNGTGVGVEDRQLVCKRGCTSKITTIEDLEQLGGTSLGFRGEALASVADLSESVILTTCVDGETKGTCLTYGSAGLLSGSSASHPVGSTVRVKDFLKTIPVRKQTALKNATKSLSSIKKLLQGYAFARGTVRFSLKVLKGKTEKANWSYTPVDRAEKLRDVAARIIGKDVAGLCEIRAYECAGNEGGEGYSAIAFLANIDSDVAKLNNTGHYISLDGRPVTASRGAIKDVIKLYRHYVRNCTSILHDLPVSFDPLLVMHISCPRGSYDVNIEPMKDEVMFINPDSVLSLVKSLFGEYYGKPAESDSVTKPLPKSNPSYEAKSSFELLLAKRPMSSVQFASEPARLLQGPNSCAPPPHAYDMAPVLGGQPGMEGGQPGMEGGNGRSPISTIRSSLDSSENNVIVDAVLPLVHSNMYGCDEDDETPPLSTGHHDLVCNIEDDADVVSRNPWSLAKINAPVRRQSGLHGSSPLPTQQQTSSTSSQFDESTSHVTPRAGAHRQPLGLRPQLPSPATSPRSPDIFQNPGPPKRPWPSRQQRDDVSELGSALEIPITPSTGDSRGVGNQLDSWVKSTAARIELPSFKRVSEMYNEDGRVEQGQDPAPSEPSRLQQSMKNASHGHPPRQAAQGRPFRSPLLKSLAGASAKNDACSPSAFGAVPSSQQTSLKLSQSQNPELDQIMEFEHRKKAAVAQQRKAYGKAKSRSMSIVELAQLQQSSIEDTEYKRGSSSMDLNEHENQANSVAYFGDRFNNRTAVPDTATKSSPHKNRYLAAAKSLLRGRNDESEAELHCSGVFSPAEITDDGHDIPKIPENDSRAYLIRHRSQTTSEDAGGLSKTGLKIRRTKTQRLPLEVVPPDMMLHKVVALLDFDEGMCSETGTEADKYNTTGKNEFIAWSSSMADVSLWQEDLTGLIERGYRARVGDGLISPNVELDLRRMIKTHCDNI